MKNPIVHHREVIGNMTLTVEQEWESSGLHWRWRASGNGIFPDLDERSSGCFYWAEDGTAHGTTFDEAVTYTIAMAKKWLTGPSKKTA